MSTLSILHYHYSIYTVLIGDMSFNTVVVIISFVYSNCNNAVLLINEIAELQITRSVIQDSICSVLEYKYTYTHISEVHETTLSVYTNVLVNVEYYTL